MHHMRDRVKKISHELDELGQAKVSGCWWQGVGGWFLGFGSNHWLFQTAGWWRFRDILVGS